MDAVSDQKAEVLPLFDDFSIAWHKTTAPIIRKEFQCLISDFVLRLTVISFWKW